MNIVRNLIPGLALMLLSATLLAEDVIKVNSMNYPAWVIRNHQTIALTPGYQLRADDLIRTGNSGRVLLQLADGSAIKLGESARFLIESAGIIGIQSESFLDSTFQVLRGAFRFTSSFFGSVSTGHRLNVKIGAITAGVRGTDIWGRSNQEQDLVALIEGSITVDTDREPTVNLQQALSFYVKARGEAPLPVDQVDPDQLKRWVNETELDGALGIAAEHGEWSLVLVSLTDMKNTDIALKEFHQKGFPVRRKSVIRDGKTLHRLLLPGFVSIHDAVRARTQIADFLGINDAWVWRKN